MVYEIRRTDIFDRWLKRLRDRRAAVAILDRLARAAAGNLGDVRFVGKGVSEMRVFIGKGYRLYFCQRGKQVIVLLCGGDKSTQQQDIERAKALAKQI